MGETIEQTNERDEMLMHGALAAAKHGLGRTSPNPMVGAVVVKEGRVVAAGWHRKAGTPHAEVHALNMAGELAKDATLYVNLEPCAHHGRTPPCVEAIIRAQIKRVVVALEDPNPKVAGKGIARLRDAGVEVTVGVLAQEARRLNEVFLKWITTKQPFVVIKTAMTLDGKIATPEGASRRITGDESLTRVHELRDMYDAIMVGVNTVIADNPQLTARLPNAKNPRRIVLDSHARIPLTAKLLTENAANTIVAVTASANQEKVATIKDTGATVIVAGEGERVNLPTLMKILGEREICSILTEGGGTVNFSLLQAGLVDKVLAFVAPKIVGGKNALTSFEGDGMAELADAVKLHDVTTETLGEDILISGYVR